MRRYPGFAVCLSTLAILLAVGCGQFGPKPKDVLSKYLDAYFRGRHEEAYQYISSNDKTSKSLEEYVSERREDQGPLAGVFASRLTYEVKELTVNGDRATADIAITLPDIRALFADIFGAAFMSAFSEETDEKEIEKMLAEKYKDKEIPTMIRAESVDLVREADGWKIFLGWQAQKRAEEEKRKEKESYLDKVLVRNLEVKDYGRLGFGGYISGEVKNTGDRTLNEVEVTIYFLDKEGKPIFEETHSPVLVSEFSFGSKPLKPGYGEKFTYRSSDAPSDWAKKIKARVTDIEFVK